MIENILSLQCFELWGFGVHGGGTIARISHCFRSIIKSILSKLVKHIGCDHNLFS